MQVFNPTSPSTNGGNPLVAAAALPSHATAAVKGGVESASASSASTNPASAASPATSTATITANDFLQLLVAELKNQDPTANVDPNEYVNQLVEVNSLQQQIQMNQTLDGGPTLTGASSGVLQELMQMNDTLDGDLAAGSSSAGTGSAAQIAHRPGGQNAVSNPATEAAATTIANALTANPHQGKAGPSGLDIPPSQMGAFAKFAARLRANRMSGTNQ